MTDGVCFEMTENSTAFRRRFSSWAQSAVVVSLLVFTTTGCPSNLECPPGSEGQSPAECFGDPEHPFPDCDPTFDVQRDIFTDTCGGTSCHTGAADDRGNLDLLADGPL